MINNIVIFGAGAVGSNLLLNLIRDIPTANYIVIDYDRVEDRNINVGSQPFLKSDIKRYKTQALQMLAYNQSGIRISVENEKIISENQINTILSKYIKKSEYDSISNSILIVDAFDNAESRNLFMKIKQDIIHIGFSPQMTGSVIWGENWTKMTPMKTDIDICTQEGARSFIMSFVSIASLAILDFHFHGEKKNIYFDKNYNLRILK